MFARVVTFDGARDIDTGVTYVRDEVAPLLRQQKGFAGLNVTTDRPGKVLAVLSLWETEGDRDASESVADKAREQGLKLIGGHLTVEHYEQILSEVVKPPTVGARLQVRHVHMDPSRVDENIDYFRREVLPWIKANPGLLLVRQMINRETGDGAVGTLWTDESSLEAAAAQADRRRQEMRDDTRVTFGQESRRLLELIEQR